MTYGNKVTHLLSGTQPVCDCALLYTAECEWMRPSDDVFLMNEPARLLYDANLDFDILPMDVITGSQPGEDWHKADVIREALRRMGLTEADKASLLMVGDRKYDVLGAAEVGVDCLGVEFFGYALPGELKTAGAIAVVETPAELLVWLREQN